MTNPQPSLPRLIISSYDDLKNPYYGGGGAQAVHQIAKRLASSFKVIVFTGKYPGAINETVDGVLYQRTGSTLFGPKLGQLVFQLCLLPQVMAGEYSLWIESFTPPFSTAFLPLFTRRPVIGLVHMLSAEDMQRKYKLPFYLVEKLGLKLYSRLITPSEFFAAKLRRLNPRAEVTFIPNGVIPPVAKSLPNNFKKFLSFIGRIEINQKGLDLLISAYAQIADQTPYKLQIAGSGSPAEISKLSALIQQNGLESSVIFRGRVEKNAKSAFFSRTAVIAISSRFETFSLSALEAMSAGIPYVCFDIDGLRWLPHNSGLKVRPFDVTAYSKALLSLLQNTKKRQTFSHHARIASRRYTWDQSAREYSEYISRILNHG